MNCKFILSLILLSGTLICSAAERFFPVIKDGKAVVELVTPDDDDDGACLEAAMLLENYLVKSTGKQLDSTGGAKIVFKIEKGKKMDPEGFRFSFPSANVMEITGGGPNGVKYGVIEFCERFMGVRFLYPGPYGKHLPKHKNLKIPMKAFSDAPKFYTRILDAGTWHKTKKIYFDWYPLLRGDAPKRLAISHNLYHMFPPAKYAVKHPDYYPIINGKRFIPVPPRTTVHWQPCMTNPAVVKEAVRMICDAFAKDPNLRTWSLGQTDGDGYCECKNCKKFYPANDVPHLFGSKDRSLLYLQFCNKIAEGVAKKYPEAKLSVFAYNHTSFAPDGIKLHPALVPVITYDRLNWVDPQRKAMDMERQKRWSSISSEVCWWDYFASNRYALPRVTLHHVANQLREGYKMRVRHAFIQHSPLGLGDNHNEQIWAEGPMAYMTYKLLWNPFQDENKILDDWYQTAVGPKAAPYLRSYFERLEKFWTKDMPRSDWFKRCARTYLVGTWHDYLFELEPKFFEKCAKDLDMVCKLAPEGDCKKRAEYFRAGFQNRREKCEYWIRDINVRRFSPSLFTKDFFYENFENGLSGWTIPPAFKQKNIVSVIPEAGKSNVLSIRFTPILEGGSVERIIPVNKKSFFRMVISYRMVDTGSRTKLFIAADWCDAKGNILEPIYSSKALRKNSFKWTKTALHFTTPEKMPAYLKIRLGASDSTKGKILFDDLSISEIPSEK